jgi:hypothetical protein
MKKCLLLLFFIAFTGMCFNITRSDAGELDLLLEKLIQKGVLSPGEAQQIKTETQEQIRSEIAEGKSSSLPQWVQKMKVKGDLRLRYQSKQEEPKNAHTKNTNIGRVRMRLGLETKVNEKILAAIGVASGSGDPRSTNISFGGYNTKKTVVLDYAYGKYSPLSALNIVAGKMLLNEALWEPSDLIWDTDITPEGAVIQLNKNIDAAEFFMNTGVLIVDEDTSTDNKPPMAYLIEPGVSFKFNDRFSIKGAVAYDCFDNTKGHVSNSKSGGSNSGNTKAGTTKYENNYKMINPSLAFKIMEPFKEVGLGVGYLELLGEYVDNVDVSHDSTGFSAGFKIGDEKVEKWGDMQFKYLYARLGKDSVLDVLPDSDRYGGKTGMKSHEGEFTFGLGKNTSFGIDVYRSYKIKDANEPETLAQFDWNLKF